jgi:hypothetical protein
MKRALLSLMTVFALTVMMYGPGANLPPTASFKAHASYASELKGATSTIMPGHVSPVK